MGTRDGGPRGGCVVLSPPCVLAAGWHDPGRREGGRGRPAGLQVRRWRGTGMPKAAPCPSPAAPPGAACLVLLCSARNKEKGSAAPPAPASASPLGLRGKRGGPGVRGGTQKTELSSHQGEKPAQRAESSPVPARSGVHQDAQEHGLGVNGGKKRGLEHVQQAPSSVRSHAPCTVQCRPPCTASE